MNYTVTLDGREVQVEADAVKPPDGHALFEVEDGPNGQARPKGFFDSTTHHAALSQAKQDATAAAEQVAADKYREYKNPHDLIRDEDFKKRFYKENGITLGADGLPEAKMPADYTALVQERDTLKAKNATLETENASYKENAERVREESLMTKLRTQWDQPETYLKREKLEADFRGQAPPFLVQAMQQFKPSQEWGTDVFYDNENNVVMDGGKPAGVKVFVELHKKSHSHLYTERKQHGSDYRDDAPQRKGKTITRSEFDRLSQAERHAKYADGVTVVDD